MPQRRKVTCKIPILASKRAPVLKPLLNWTGSDFPLLITFVKWTVLPVIRPIIELRSCWLLPYFACILAVLWPRNPDSPFVLFDPPNIGDHQPYTATTKDFESKKGFQRGWCTNCQNPWEQQNVYHSQDCTGDVHHGFRGGGARIVGFDFFTQPLFRLMLQRHQVSKKNVQFSEAWEPPQFQEETLWEWKGHFRSSGRVPGCSRSSSRSSESNFRNVKIPFSEWRLTTWAMRKPQFSGKSQSDSRNCCEPTKDLSWAPAFSEFFFKNWGGPHAPETLTRKTLESWANKKAKMTNRQTTSHPPKI